MALPANLQGHLSPNELEFISENETIKILPNFSMDEVDLITGRVGPFRPPLLASVPIWFAIMLRARNKCKIEIPSWLKIDNLKKQLDKERASQGFSDLPKNYLEMAHLLFEGASDDIIELPVVRNLLKELRELRLSKAREGMKSLNPDYLQMDHLSLMEINEIRPFFKSGFRTLNSLQDRPHVTPHHKFFITENGSSQQDGNLMPSSQILGDSSQLRSPFVGIRDNISLYSMSPTTPGDLSRRA